MASITPKKRFHPARPLPIALEVSALGADHPLFHDRPHTRQFLTLLLLRGGSGTHLLDGEALAVRPGELRLLSPQQVYDGRGVRGAHGWLVVFEPSAIEPGAGHPGGLAPGATPDPPGLDAADPLPSVLRLLRYTVRSGWPVLPAEALARWDFWCREAADELRRTQPGYQAAARAYLRLMLTDISRLTEPHLRLTPGHRPLLGLVFAYIDAHFQDPIRLADVARQVHRSRSHLTDLVRRETGLPVLAWIHERRLAEARKLLLGTPLSVEQVAAQVGYADPTALIRRFKRATGLTPAAWRRALR